MPRIRTLPVVACGVLVCLTVSVSVIPVIPVIAHASRVRDIQTLYPDLFEPKTPVTGENVSPLVKAVAKALHQWQQQSADIGTVTAQGIAQRTRRPAGRNYGRVHYQTRRHRYGYHGHPKHDSTPAPRPEAAFSTTGMYNVMDYGAKSDCNSSGPDNTAAFQTALNSASQGGGGVVYAPPGCYHFQGNLTVAAGVTLQGSYSVVPSHQMVGEKTRMPPQDGTVLCPHAGKGTGGSGTAFITGGMVRAVTKWRLQL